MFLFLFRFLFLCSSWLLIFRITSSSLLLSSSSSSLDIVFHRNSVILPETLLHFFSANFFIFFIISRGVVERIKSFCSVTIFFLLIIFIPLNNELSRLNFLCFLSFFPILNNLIAISEALRTMKPKAMSSIIFLVNWKLEWWIICKINLSRKEHNILSSRCKNVWKEMFRN